MSSTESERFVDLDFSELLSYFAPTYNHPGGFYQTQRLVDELELTSDS
jgi:hypothetical protein